MTNAVSGMSAALYRDEAEEYVVTPALGSDRDICFVSKNHTTNKVEIVVGGITAPLSVAVVGPKLTITSANTDGSATSTAAEIVAAVNDDAGAFALFEARLPPGSDGSGVTGAMSEATAADGVAFTDLALVDSGDHMVYQAAKGFRYWDSGETLTVEVDGSEVTTGFTVNYLQGKVTFDASQGADPVTVTGTRRSPLAFERILLVYDISLKLDGEVIPTDNLDDDGWGSAIMGAKSWEIASNTYYYDGNIPLSGIGDELFVKLYAILSTDKSWVGYGAILSSDLIIANPKKAQEQSIKISGKGEIFPEF